MRTLLIILLIFCFTKLTHGQYIEKSSVDSGGASAINGGIELLYTLGEVNAQERSSGNTVVSEGFVSPAFRIRHRFIGGEGFRIRQLDCNLFRIGRIFFGVGK